jgi:hypothetical protein
MVNLLKNGITLAQYSVYVVILFVIIYLCVQVLKSILGFDVFFKWWNKNGGKQYKQGFDMMSFALFQESRLAFNIRQAFIPGQDRLTYTDVMLLQSIAFNQARVFTDSDGNPIQGNFVLPHHICQGIAWSSADNPVFKNLYKYWYNAANNAQTINNTDSEGGIVNTTSGYNWPLKYVQNNSPDPEDSKIWTNILGHQCGGFWPHQNGCFGFFDMPGTPENGVTPYDLLTNPARSVIGESKSLSTGSAPVYRADKSIYLQGDKNGDSNVVSMYYIPGYAGPQGSWAQLFADFGIIYTESSLSGDSKVPVISDGALCSGSNKKTPLNPCPLTCGYKTTCGDMPPSGTGMPISDFNIWYESSRWMATGGSQKNPAVYGPNFFSAFRMNPQSYVFTSWVGNLYDDPSTGIILDPQAIKNLIGMAEPGIRGQTGGWIRFLKGINTDLKSYDEIMNELFSTYATNFTSRAQIQNTNLNCGINGWLASGASLLGGLAMFALCPELGPIGIAVIASGSLLSGITTAADKGCLTAIGIKP